MPVQQHRWIGRRVRLQAVKDVYTHLKPGDEGTVTRVYRDPVGTVIDVAWDSGSSLSLIPDEDSFLMLGDGPSGQPTQFGPRVVDIAAAPPVGSPPGAQTLPPTSLSAPGADAVAQASRLWDDAQVQALARRGVEAELVDGRICLTRNGVERLLVALPVQPVKAAVGTRQLGR